MLRKLSRAARGKARGQHWIITREQLLAIGYTNEAIDWRIGKGRLHPIYRGIYAVDRPPETVEAIFIAAVLACGVDAALSHDSAAQLWDFGTTAAGVIHVSIPERRRIRARSIRVHRRTAFETTQHRGIPVTTPICTVIDIAPTLDDERLERCINNAGIKNLVHPDRLHRAVQALPHRRGARRVRLLLDRDAFIVTDTMLEQRFLRILRKAGLPLPQTQVRLPGGRVDFYWPELRLVVEVDGLRFHRTAAQQRKDVLRDQKHVAAGLRPLRFTHWQVFKEPGYVATYLAEIMRPARAR